MYQVCGRIKLMAKDMSGKHFPGQHDDEEVISLYRKHPVVMRKGLIFFMLWILAGLLPFSFYFYTSWAPPLLLGCIVIGLLTFFYSWIGWYFTVCIVTDQRLIQISQKGLFNRSVVDLGLDKIQNVNFQIAGLQETLLGFGTINIQTFVGDLILEQMHHPQEIQQELIRVIKENGYTIQEETTDQEAGQAQKHSSQDDEED